MFYKRNRTEDIIVGRFVKQRQQFNSGWMYKKMDGRTDRQERQTR